jgi:hypothetical protein
MPESPENAGSACAYIPGMNRFDTDSLRDLLSAKEVSIRTDKHPDSAVVIWVVVTDDEVFVRSFRGTKGRWYRDLATGGPATLEFAGRSLRVQAIPANDPAAIDRASRAYLGKYRSSSYAQAMVQPEMLPTTLHLEPRRPEAPSKWWHCKPFRQEAKQPWPPLRCELM